MLGRPDPAGPPTLELAALCCSRRSSSASSSRSCFSGLAAAPHPRGGSCSCWSPATSSTAGGTGTTACCWPASTIANQVFVVGMIAARSATAPSGPGACRRGRRQPRCARLLQVLRLLRRLGHEHARRRSASGCLRRSCRSSCRSGSRSSRSRRMSYVIDIYRGKLEPVALLDFAVYLSFFPHLVAGPIVRATEFLPQLKERADPRHLDGSPRVPAHRRGHVQEGRRVELPRQHHRRPGLRRAQATTARSRSCSRSTATRSRSTRTSADTPTSRSASRCCSASASRRTSTRPTPRDRLQDFWRRWHMTLSRWLRDYLYIPLGGNRGSAAADLPQPHAHDAASAGCGTGRRGRSWCGAASTASAWRSSDYRADRRADPRASRAAADARRAGSSSGSSPSTWCASRGCSSVVRRSTPRSPCFSDCSPRGARRRS